MDIKNLNSVPTERLLELWRRAIKLYAQLASVSHIVEGFVLTTEIKVRELTEKNFPGHGLEMVPILTLPTHHSFITTEHYELCLIGLEVQRKFHTPASVEDFLHSESVVVKLKNHQEKYYWKLNSYSSAKCLSVTDFAKELFEMFEKNTDFEKIITNYNSLPEKIVQRDKLISQIKDAELVTLLTIGEAIVRIHDRRKECITFMLTYVDTILKEIATRVGIPFTDARYICPSEVSSVAQMGDELKKRRAQSLYVFTANEELVFTGETAAQYYKKLHKDTGYENPSELRGNCASKGKVQGIVKLCRGEKEIALFEEGQILVACMTQPEFVPAMKKAKAIITDEGGLTCHAAIISRELGIPCVIGTKIATQVLKDGDMVEVDAEKGIVKKI